MVDVPMADQVRPYSGVRIIDLTAELGSYAGRLFADLGAEVIRVEPPEGRRDRRVAPSFSGMTRSAGGVPFAFLNVNKSSVVLDVTTAEGAVAFRELVASASVVLFEPGPRQDYELAAVLDVPGERITTIISYFGLRGPYAGYVGSDLVAQALGGIAWLTGEPGKPPLRLAGEQSYFVTSLYAAAATAIALWDLEEGGSAHVLDVSAQECIAHSLQNAIQVYDLEGRVFSRGGIGTRDATESAFRCKDGFVFLAAPLSLSASWTALTSWMQEEGFDGYETLANDPRWMDRPARATKPMYDEFRGLFERFIAEKSRAELRAEALKRKLVLAPVSSISDLQFDPQLLFRGFFSSLDMPALGREVMMPGAPYRLSEPLWQLNTSAPGLGDGAAQRPAATGDA
jgi:benzylsuccinate CoA-transferase BbsE subunit